MENKSQLKEFSRYCTLNVLGMIGLSCYILADTFFVSKGLGRNGLTALNLAIPVYSFIHGSGLMLGIGGATKYSIFKSNKERKNANTIFTNTFYLATVISIVFVLVGIFLSKSLTTVLGSDSDVFKMTNIYLKCILIFAPAFIINDVLICFIRNDNNPNLSMYAMLGGSLSNIILDYIFIFPLGLGIKGAAIATGLGQLVTIGILLPHFIMKKGILTFGNVKLEKKIIKKFINIGFPSFFAEVSFSIIIFFMNLALVNYGGETSLSAFAIINYITTNIYMVLLGLSIGVQPLLSYNYGARRSKKMLGFYSITIKAVIIINIVFIAICCIFGKGMISIFTSDSRIVDIAYIGLILSTFGYFMVGFNLTSTVYYQAINMPRISNIFCLSRSLILLPISLFILSKLFGINGIWITLFVSELITFIL